MREEIIKMTIKLIELNIINIYDDFVYFSLILYFDVSGGRRCWNVRIYGDIDR